jgi:hypothetical protein
VLLDEVNIPPGAREQDGRGRSCGPAPMMTILAIKNDVIR